MNETVQLTERSGSTSSQRKQGYVPAVVYGAGLSSISLKAEAKTIDRILSYNPHAILKADLPGAGTKHVMIQEVQRQPLSRALLHVDFLQIDMKAEIDTKVTLSFAGDAAGVRSGGVLQTELYELDIRTMPDKLEPTLEVDISGLEIGDQLLVSDLQPKQGWEILNDPETLVVKIAPPVVSEAADDAEAGAEEAAEGSEEA